MARNIIDRLETLSCCPCCGSENIAHIGGETEKENFILYEDYMCEDCGKKYVIEYEARAVHI